MNALPDIHLDRRVAIVCVFLAVECLDVPLAVLIGVVDNPAFLLLTLTGCPSAFAYRHPIVSFGYSRCALLGGFPSFSINAAMMAARSFGGMRFPSRLRRFWICSHSNRRCSGILAALSVNPAR